MKTMRTGSTARPMSLATIKPMQTDMEAGNRERRGYHVVSPVSADRGGLAIFFICYDVPHDSRIFAPSFENF